MNSRIFSGKPFFFLVILLNLIGAFYGFIFYYGKQLLATNPLLWLFVPDCPLAALFFAVSLALLYLRKRMDWFFFLSAAAAFKYGFWTLFVLAGFSNFYFSPATAFMYAVLFVAHIGLMIEPIAFIGRINFRPWFLLPVAIFLFLNEVSDYFLFTHPSLPASELSFMLYASLAMSLGALIAAFFLFRKKTSPLLELPFLD